MKALIVLFIRSTCFPSIYGSSFRAGTGAPFEITRPYTQPTPPPQAQMSANLRPLMPRFPEGLLWRFPERPAGTFAGLLLTRSPMGLPALLPAQLIVWAAMAICAARKHDWDE